MRSVLLLLALLLAPVVLPPAAAQTSDDVLLLSRRQATLGARLAGQGGAAIGGLGGWTASFANPANLGWLRTSQASASLAAFGIESDARYRLADADAAAGFEGTTFQGDTRSSGARLGHLGYAAKVPTVRGSFVVGIGYNQTASYDRSLFYDAEIRGTSDGTPFTERFEQDVFEEGQAGELSAATAVEVAPGVMAGASLNVLIGSYFIETTTDADFFDETPSTATFDLDTRGLNARIGISAEAQPGLRLGFVVETPTYVAVREQGVDDLSGFLPIEYDYTTPWRLGAGVVYQVAGATLAADVEYVDWSQARIRTDGFTDADDLEAIAEENATFRRSYQEALTTRFGAAYNFGLATVRLGLAYQPDPLREDPFIVADRLRRTVTAGVGIRLGPSAEANLALVNTQFEDQLVSVDNLGDTPDTVSLVVEDVNRTALVVGIAFGF